MKRSITIIVFFFLYQGQLFAQWFCEKVPATGGEKIENSNSFMDILIIGTALIIVLFTLVMSIKYLFLPGEKDKDHIKNIVKDEGF